MALVARRLSLRPRLRGLPSQVAARRAALGDRRRPYDPERRRRGQPSRRRSSPPRSPPGSSASPPRPGGRAGRVRDRHRAARPLVVGGSRWLAQVLRSAPAHGVELVTLARRARATARAARAARSSWGEGKDLARGTRPRSPTSPGRRAARAALLRALGAGLARPRAASVPRASCSRCRRATGPFSTAAARRATTRSRATGHAGAMLEAIDSGAATGPADAQPRARPEPHAPARDLEPSPDPLLGVPAADRGRARAPRPQALREPGPGGTEVHVLTRGSEESPRRRSSAGSTSTASASPAARPTSASSSPGSSA